MRKWWARIGCLLLALLLAASALPVFAAGDESVLEEDAQEDVTDDFVILLDCSMSTSANDTKNLCLQACWDFLDKLPIYDTRVSIMTFGYEVKDGEDYDYYDDYSSFTVESEADKKLIHEIVRLVEQVFPEITFGGVTPLLFSTANSAAIPEELTLAQAGVRDSNRLILV